MQEIIFSILGLAIFLLAPFTIFFIQIIIKIEKHEARKKRVKQTPYWDY